MGEYDILKLDFTLIFENMAVIGIVLMILVFLIAACCGSTSENGPSKRQNQHSPFPSRNRAHGVTIGIRSGGFGSDRDDDDH